MVPLGSHRLAVRPTAFLSLTCQLDLKFLLREAHNVLHGFIVFFPDTLSSWVVGREASKLVIPSPGGVIYHGLQSLLDPLPQRILPCIIWFYVDPIMFDRRSND